MWPPRNLARSIHSTLGTMQTQLVNNENMKKTTFILFLILNLLGCKNRHDDLILSTMNSFIKDDGNNTGLLFGCNEDGRISIWTVGGISKDDELRVACPTSKPIISYLILKNGIDLNTPISKWFPQKDGYTLSDSITVKMLLLNSSGIRDFVRLVPNHPDSIVTVERTINIAYKNKELMFKPGTSWEYSNTNFNLLGLILEKELKKTFENLVLENFHSIAPSIKMDDGKAKYPKCYVNPWPYHWAAPGYAGGMVSTAEDAIKTFGFISKQKEFSIMSKSYNLDGSDAQNDKLGLGIYLDSNYGGLGKTIYYDGIIGVSKMNIYSINNKIYYVYAPYPCQKDLKEIAIKLIKIMNQ